MAQVDKTYGTNKNRKWCKEKKIRITITSKGKPKELTAYQKKKSKKEYNERNQIEGKIGQAKQGYHLNQSQEGKNIQNLDWSDTLLSLI